jgi:RimJ/RimL family protein N-acetyltransferase
MDPLTNIHLRNDVRLGELKLEYAQNMFRWMCDSSVSHNLGLRSQPTLERTQQWIEQSRQDPTKKLYAVLQADEHVGNVILDRLDNYLQTMRLSVYIGASQDRGSGIGTTGIYLVLNDAFSRLNLYKVWLTVHVRNIAAIRTYLRLGFQQEGVLRGEFILGDERISALYMGVIQPDFEKLKVSWT